MTGSSLPGVGDEFGRYRIDGQIGFGGMGMVLAATDLQLGRKVALKVIAAQLATSDEFRARFEREATLMTRMDSPHVLTVYDHGVLDGVPWLATPHIAGGDLGGLLRERGAMPLPMAATVCAQVASALHDAHQVGIVHRDVKPANILLRDPDAAEPFSYLCDFGIAHTGESGLTHTGSVAGSWSYIAPERIKGGPGTPQTDVYALGCVFWACLTGHAPYSGTDIEVAMAHAQAPVPQLAATDPLSQQVNRVLTKALAKDPAERYATAGEFRQDLLALTRGGSLAASAFPPPPPAPGLTISRGAVPAAPKKSRKGLLLVAGVAVLAVLGGAATGGWFLLKDDETGGKDGKDGNGTAEAPHGPWVPGDMNDDGKADLMFSNYSFNSETKRDNMLNTVYSTGSRFGTLQSKQDPGSTDVTGDWDGDGLPDLVTQRYLTEDGNFRAKIRAATGEQIIVKPARKRVRDDAVFDLADMNGDGRDDLVLISKHKRDDSWGTYIEVGLSTDEGFDEPTIWFSDPDLIAGLAQFHFADINGDGKEDVLALKASAVQIPDKKDPDGERHYDELRVLENQDGSLVEVGERFHVLKPAVTWYISLAIARDGAGGLNLVVARPTEKDGEEGGDIVSLHPLTMDGVGKATWTYHPDEGGLATSGYAALDVDGDGDDDLLFARDARDQSYHADVSLWNGTEFEEPTTWYAWECEFADCDGESLSMVLD